MGYPIVLDLRGRAVTVIGGGAVATRKIARLLDEGARVTVISPSASESIQAWAGEGRVRLLVRAYESGDVEGAELVFAATDSAQVNAEVAAKARERGQWVNVADDSTPSDFTLPATAAFGLLQLAIDTSAGGPALSSALRQHLEATLAPGWGRGASIFKELRPLVRPLGDEATRRVFWRMLASELPSAAEDSPDELVAWVEKAAARSGLPFQADELEQAVRRAIEQHERLIGGHETAG
ncbi:MAG TPA: bifunctional precorrin-2 dehydrogenase/sirohydrochlorin ferrochelatase [Ardenticatenaceae bacterium]